MRRPRRPRKARRYRRSLENLSGIRTRFTAVLRRRHKGNRRILLIDVKNSETGAQLTDHLWFREGKWSSRIRPRTSIAFDARVVPYLKGPGPAKLLDYRLERPTRIQVLSRPPRSRRRSPRNSPAQTTPTQP